MYKPDLAWTLDHLPINAACPHVTTRLVSSTLRRNSRVLPFPTYNHYQTDLSNYHRRTLGFASYHQCLLPGRDAHWFLGLLSRAARR